MTSIQCYCKNPSAYKDLYPEDTLSYLNMLCRSRSNSSSQLYDIAKLAGKDAEHDAKAVSEVLAKAVSNMLLGMLTPKGLEMLSAMIGINFGAKLAYKVVIQSIKTLSIELATMAERSAIVGAEAGINAAAANISVVTTELTSELAAAIIEVGNLTIDFLSTVAGGVGAAFMIIQLLSMIFDTWDPCHYKDQLDDKTIKSFSDAFNTAFREQGLKAYDSFTDSYGRTEYLNIWPVEYTASKFILDQHTNKDYKNKLTIYMAQYLSALRVNSDGDAIRMPEGGKLLSDMDPTLFRTVEDDISLFLSDGNTVVSNFLVKYWPFFVVIVIIILIFLIYIVK